MSRANDVGTWSYEPFDSSAAKVPSDLSQSEQSSK